MKWIHFENFFAECPDCDSIFHLQRGGCIHFTCKQCGADFCGFCSRIFFNKKKPCRECEPKKQDALHAHHPRNCFYYLRDESLEWLIELLEVSYNHVQCDQSSVLASLC